MPEEKKTKKLIFQAVAGIYFAASLVTFYFLYEGNQSLAENTERQLEIQERNLDSLSKVKDLFEEMLVADNFFITGQYDSAYAAYKILNEERVSSSVLNDFIAMRKQRILEIQESRDTLLGDIQAYQFMMVNLRNKNDSMNVLLDTLFQQITVKQEKYNKEIARLDNTVTELNNKLASKEKIQVISFRNEKGNLIHYLGEVRDGMANGGGVGIFDTGGIYKGEWKNNQRHGKGTYEWKDGHKYEGEFVNGEREGQGTYLWSSGEKYVGQWKAGKRSGKGTLFDKDNNISYEGLWEDDKIKK